MIRSDFGSALVSGAQKSGAQKSGALELVATQGSAHATFQNDFSFWNKIHFCKAKIASKLENREGTKGDEKHVATSLLLNVS